MKNLRIPLILFLCLTSFVSTKTAATELGVRSTQFTLDGKQVFLLGISYYGAQGAPWEAVQKDLSDMQRLGVRWIRVWATWGAHQNDVTAVDRSGRPRKPYWSRLKRLVEECDRRGMVVDVTLSRGNGAVGAPRLQSLEVHRQAVVTIVRGLRSSRNWYLDLGNERNIRDKRHVPFKELRDLRNAAKEVDPHRLITASHAGDISRQDLKQYLKQVRVDFISPHRPRNRRSPGETKKMTLQYLAWMRELGKTVPVHYQEPFRRGFTRGWNPSAKDFVTDARGAREGGAAGWCLHNGSERFVSDGQPRRSFDMREKRLFDQLDAEERKALDKLSTLTASDPPARSKQTHIYKDADGVKIHLDVYRPDDTKLRPVAVWIHGGALILGGRQGVPSDIKKLCSQEGFALVSIDYRLAPEVKVPAIIEDVQDAFAWIRTQGPKVAHLNPKRLVVAGGSAGGYLTLMTGICVKPRPTALVAYWGYGDIDGDWYTKPSPHYRQAVPIIKKEEVEDAVGKGVLTHVDSRTPFRRERGSYYHYLRQNGFWTKVVSGFDPETEKEKLTPYCPVRNVSPEHPPTLLVHGTKDTDVPYSKSADMARELARHKVPHELVTVPDAGHGLAGGDKKLVAEARAKALAFIREHLEAAR